MLAPTVRARGARGANEASVDGGDIAGTMDIAGMTAPPEPLESPDQQVQEA